MCNFKLVV